MRLGSLFTGYGGLDMAAHAVLGTETAWHCDNDPAAVALLAHHFPDVPNLGDITEVDWAQVEPVYILAGGFPCQDISSAGKRAGIGGERSGLWSHYVDAIRVLRPRYVLIENVSALVVRGLDRVLADLAALGFDAEWTTVRASVVGAPHQRERVFIVARDATGKGLQGRTVGRLQPVEPVSGRLSAADPAGDGRHERRAEPAGVERGSDAAECGAPAANAEGCRRSPLGDAIGGEFATTARPGGPPASPGNSGDAQWGQYEPVIRRWEHIIGRPAPEPTVVGARGGRVLNPALVEWMMGLPQGWITSVPGITRSQMLKLAGNGVVPQQAAAAFGHLLTRQEVAA